MRQSETISEWTSRKPINPGPALYLARVNGHEMYINVRRVRLLNGQRVRCLRLHLPTD